MKTIQYKDAVNLEQDLINKPNWSDFMAEAFSKAGSAPVTKPGDFEANAALLGMGAGFKGAANQKRAEQSAPILEEAGRIRAKAAEIEAQTQESEQSRLLVTQFFKQSAVPIAHLSQASIARDIPAANKIAKGIYSKFKRDFGDPTIGDFDHYHDGVIYYENLETGNIEGKNVIGLMYQAGIDPVSIWGQDAPMIEAGLSAGAKKNYEDFEKMRQLEMQGKRADIANKYSQVGYHNAQTGKIENEIANPVNQYQEKYNIQAALKNQDEVYKTITPKLEKQEQTLGMYDRLEDATDAATWTRGNSSTAAILRFLAKETGMDENIATADLTSLQMESTLKEMLGAAFGQEEGERILGKMVGPRKNYAAFKKQIEVEKDKLIKDIVKNKIRVATFAKERHANLEHPDLYTNLDNQIEDYKIETKRKTKTNQNKTESGNQNLPSDEELGIKFY